MGGNTTSAGWNPVVSKGACLKPETMRRNDGISTVATDLLTDLRIFWLISPQFAAFFHVGGVYLALPSDYPALTADIPLRYP